MDRLEEALSWLEKARDQNPKARGFLGFLAATYAQLGRVEEAGAEMSKFTKGWPASFKNLHFIMQPYTFKDLIVADRLAEGFFKAGISGRPSDYYRIQEKHRLTGEVISSLVLGKNVFGINPSTGVKSTITCDREGNATFQLGTSSFQGRRSVEGDMLCDRIRILSKGIEVKQCCPVFLNPDGTRDEGNEYISCTDFGFMIWSPEKQMCR